MSFSSISILPTYRWRDDSSRPQVQKRLVKAPRLKDVPRSQLAGKTLSMRDSPLDGKSRSGIEKNNM
jgi:hypothetical protein